MLQARHEKKKELTEVFIDDVELTEEQEKLEKLSSSEKDVMNKIIDWLKVNRDYRNEDFSDKFKAERIIPLIKYVNYGDLIFEENTIKHKLRRPLEFKNASGQTGRTLETLTFQPRYQDYQLQNASKGIDLNREGLKFVSAQISVLTGEAASVISKLWDFDSSIAKLISSLYFLE